VPYVTGTDTPGSEDEDKVWHRLDSNGKPIGTFLYYNGAWRREYSGRPNQVCYYQGDPQYDFDTDGRGISEGDWDGWHLCNGLDGTMDMSDRFIVGSKIYEAAGLGWRTDVSGAPTHLGGAKDIQLDETNTYQPARAAVTVAKWKADGNTPDVGSGLYGAGASVTLVPGEAGVLTPPAIPTLPPYFALALVVFVGYL
ncbi:MAG: hypothetical protein QOJ65_1868, partial [Fimbriimonadaceae bacterium]|nr:hypothetical protein [Fimbriimonadaceae bacterium]